MRPKAFLEDEGAGAHLAPATRVALQGAYGRWLGYLAIQNPKRLAFSAARRVDVDLVASYVEQLAKSRTASGIATELHFLRLALRILCQDINWSWLKKVAKRIAIQAKPLPRRHHLVTSERLFALGLELMDQAMKNCEGRVIITKSHAIGYRDGLLIALLAAIPLRRRTLAALRIGTHVVKSGDAWALDIPAQDTKTRKALEFSLSPSISDRIDVYLNRVRPRIPGAATHDGFWASNKGQPLDDGAIYDMVCRRTGEAFGFAVNLHRFRHGAATFWSIQDPKNVCGSKDLLGHDNFAQTDTHYLMAQSRIAGRKLADAIQVKSKPEVKSRLPGRPSSKVYF